jgi:hypothetical protein
VISEYLDLLGAALSFDRSLSRSVRREVEDHLCEAVAANPACNRLEAERRAISHFGDPHLLAAQFAIVSLAKHTRRAGAAVILVVAGVFIAMKARVAWYAAMQWSAGDDVRAAGAIVLSIDRYAFWLSVILGITGFVYITSSRIPPTFYPVYHNQLRRFSCLCTVATAALVVSVISDGLLTALQLYGMQFCAQSLIPIFSVVVEILWASMLIFQIRSITRRRTCTVALLKT